MNEKSKNRLKNKKWLLPEAEMKKKINTKVGIGDLVIAGRRVCLVLKFSKHKKQWQKRVLVQWVGETQSYWINYNTFLELINGG